MPSSESLPIGTLTVKPPEGSGTAHRAYARNRSLARAVSAASGGTIHLTLCESRGAGLRFPNGHSSASSGAAHRMGRSTTGIAVDQQMLGITPGADYLISGRLEKHNRPRDFPPVALRPPEGSRRGLDPVPGFDLSSSNPYDEKGGDHLGGDAGTGAFPIGSFLHSTASISTKSKPRRPTDACTGLRAIFAIRLRHIRSGARARFMKSRASNV
jgi:hypothetical protein